MEPTWHDEQQPEHVDADDSEGSHSEYEAGDASEDDDMADSALTFEEADFDFADLNIDEADEVEPAEIDAQLRDAQPAVDESLVLLGDSLDELLAGSWCTTGSEQDRERTIEDLCEIMSSIQLAAPISEAERLEAADALPALLETGNLLVQELEKQSEDATGLPRGALRGAYKAGSEWNLDGHNPLTASVILVCGYPVSKHPGFRGGDRSMRNLGLAGLWDLVDSGRLGLMDLHNHAHPSGENDELRPKPAEGFWPGEHPDLNEVLEGIVTKIVTWRRRRSSSSELVLVTFGRGGANWFQKPVVQTAFRDALGYDYKLQQVFIPATPTRYGISCGIKFPAIIYATVVLPTSPDVKASVVLLQAAHPSYFLYGQPVSRLVPRLARAALAIDKVLGLLRSMLRITTAPRHVSHFSRLAVPLDTETRAEAIRHVCITIHLLARRADNASLELAELERRYGFYLAEFIDHFYNVAMNAPARPFSISESERPASGVLAIAVFGIRIKAWLAQTRLSRPHIMEPSDTALILSDGRPAVVSSYTQANARKSASLSAYSLPLFSRLEDVDARVDAAPSLLSAEGRLLTTSIQRSAMEATGHTKAELSIPLASGRKGALGELEGCPVVTDGRLSLTSVAVRANDAGQHAVINRPIGDMTVGAAMLADDGRFLLESRLAVQQRAIINTNSRLDHPSGLSDCSGIHSDGRLVTLGNFGSTRVAADAGGSLVGAPAIAAGHLPVMTTDGRFLASSNYNIGNRGQVDSAALVALPAVIGQDGLANIDCDGRLQEMQLRSVWADDGPRSRGLIRRPAHLGTDDHTVLSGDGRPLATSTAEASNMEEKKQKTSLLLHRPAIREDQMLAFDADGRSLQINSLQVGTANSLEARNNINRPLPELFPIINDGRPTEVCGAAIGYVKSARTHRTALNRRDTPPAS